MYCPGTPGIWCLDALGFSVLKSKKYFILFVLLLLAPLSFPLKVDYTWCTFSVLQCKMQHVSLLLLQCIDAAHEEREREIRAESDAHVTNSLKNHSLPCCDDIFRYSAPALLRPTALKLRVS